MLLEPPPTHLLEGASLFLDFDGTLVAIADRPDAILVDAGLPALLRQLVERLEGRVVLVSGRAASDVRAWLGPLDITVAGSHGLERPGAPAPTATATQAFQPLRDLTQRVAGLLLEEKPLGAALHYRQAPEAEELCRAAVTAVAAASGLAVQPGKMVFELKPAGGDKGSAVTAIMAEPPFRGTRPFFIGDDLTDEHGFAAAAALGGAGILVGEPRTTAATFALADVPAVHTWLAQAAEALA
ncbi:trehalose-phosphatase [Sphingomonas astaxanthinifaciens]|uniref:Trehalose 6-phosphate phosphatase n=1 Tax=Sphingomonas astaxanthinifaciens DSM 22298 TaxID=1123267 RepID=A0ABQ5Z2W2_9SPHN|nr:trehalose-phosphatase [Sphingomonas astaxanthinifaciens]GLR47078.1 trehalose 6-phosphate phosphatase [Sphingomonas astaxanthinifaciens DSM 22298]